MATTRYVLRQGNVGISVNKMQGYLNIFQSRGIIRNRLVEDGIYGDHTSTSVRQFQAYANLPIDGIIGNETWDAIVNLLRTLDIVTNIPVASSSYFLVEGNTGIEVFKMQEYINEIAATDKCLRPVVVDGNYGPLTTEAVRQYQYLNNLEIDGEIGRYTWDSIVNTRDAL